MEFFQYCFVLFFAGCSSSLDGLISSGQVELHHIFPQEFRNDFSKAGINIDDFAISLSKKSHRGVRKGLQYVPTNWNESWRQYLIKHPNPPQKQLYKQAEKMLSAAGGKGEFNFYNYLSKIKSGATLAGSKAVVCIGRSRFWRFFGTLGNWIIQKFYGYKFGAMLISVLTSIVTIVLGAFGIKVERPVAVGIGIGIVVCIIGFFALIGIIYMVPFLSHLVKGVVIVISLYPAVRVLRRQK